MKKVNCILLLSWKIKKTSAFQTKAEVFCRLFCTEEVIDGNFDVVIAVVFVIALIKTAV